MRTFDTGATRNVDVNKMDYEAFLSPLALEEYAKYMHAHRKQKDGTIRDGDNWQRGIPLSVYLKSLWRHFFDMWATYRGAQRFDSDDGHTLTMREICCSVIFNAMGYLHETIKAEDAAKLVSDRQRSRKEGKNPIVLARQVATVDARANEASSRKLQTRRRK